VPQVRYSAQPVTRYDAVILFADLVGSARLSDVHTLLEYDRIVDQFQNAAAVALAETQVIPDFDCCDGGVRGDELVFILVHRVLDDPSREQEISRRALLVALHLGFRLRTSWFLDKLNQDRVEAGASPHGLALGFHRGLVAFGPHRRGRWERTAGSKPWTWRLVDPLPATPEGFAINFGKRVETASRAGNSSEMAVSQSFLSACSESGIPLRASHPLPIEAKGFERAEPVFEITGQDAITSLPQLDLLQPAPLLNAYRHDPDKTRWLLDLYLYRKLGSGLSREYSAALELATQAMIIRHDPGLSHWAGRFAHRIDDFQYAIACYEQAMHDPAYVWANLDKATSLWRRATVHGLGRTESTKDAIATDCYNAWRSCNEVIRFAPRHFFAYNLRALIAGSAMFHAADRIGALDHDNEEIRDLGRALGDVDQAERLNPLPRYLYAGTRAFIWAAQKKGKKALELIASARELLKPYREELPSEHFWQPGYALFSFSPPRPSRLLQAWGALCEDLRE